MSTSIIDQKLQLHFDTEIVYFLQAPIIPTPHYCIHPLQRRNLYDMHDTTTQTPKTQPRPVRKQKQTPQHFSEGPLQKLHKTTRGAIEHRNFGNSV